MKQPASILGGSIFTNSFSPWAKLHLEPDLQLPQKDSNLSIGSNLGGSWRQSLAMGDWIWQTWSSGIQDSRATNPPRRGQHNCGSCFSSLKLGIRDTHNSYEQIAPKPETFMLSTLSPPSIHKHRACLPVLAEHCLVSVLNLPIRQGCRVGYMQLGDVHCSECWVSTTSRPNFGKWNEE